MFLEVIGLICPCDLTGGGQRVLQSQKYIFHLGIFGMKIKRHFFLLLGHLQINYHVSHSVFIHVIDVLQLLTTLFIIYYLFVKLELIAS